MTLIKSATGSDHLVRALLEEAPPKPIEAPPKPDPLLLALQAELEDTRRHLDEAIEALPLETARAAEAAKREAEAAFVRNEADALAALEDGLARAREALDRELDKLEPLALLLCRTALENIFSRTEDYAPLVTQAIDHQMAAVRSEMILSVVVSEGDFTPEMLSALRAPPGVEVKRVSTLDRGACRIELRLGAIELSIPGYWSELEKRLNALAEAA